MLRADKSRPDSWHSGFIARQKKHWWYFPKPVQYIQCWGFFLCAGPHFRDLGWDSSAQRGEWSCSLSVLNGLSMILQAHMCGEHTHTHTPTIMEEDGVCRQQHTQLWALQTAAGNKPQTEFWWMLNGWSFTQVKKTSPNTPIQQIHLRQNEVDFPPRHSIMNSFKHSMITVWLAYALEAAAEILCSCFAEKGRFQEETGC